MNYGILLFIFSFMLLPALQGWLIADPKSTHDQPVTMVIVVSTLIFICIGAAIKYYLKS